MQELESCLRSEGLRTNNNLGTGPSLIRRSNLSSNNNIILLASGGDLGENGGGVSRNLIEPFEIC